MQIKDLTIGKRWKLLEVDGMVKKYDYEDTAGLNEYESDLKKKGSKIINIEDYLKAGSNVGGIFELSQAEINELLTEGLVSKEDIKTGFWNKMRMVLAQTTGPLGIEKFLALDVAKAQQKLMLLAQMGKTAFIRNPRFPVAELDKVLALFPDPKLFFEDPQIALENLKAIKYKTLELIKFNLGIMAKDLPGAQDAELNNAELYLLYDALQEIDITEGTKNREEADKNLAIVLQQIDDAED